MESLLNSIKTIAKYTEIYLALGVGLIILMMIVPIPSYLLDILLAVSISISLVLLMTSLLIKSPMEMTTFPTILLISTVLRLSLNLASTRLILNDGYRGPAAAGNVINAFGNFLVGGNIIIGFIVFIIIIIINFVVITKGATRIAEVSARFILDAIPGKQMAIDADLSAGIITEQEASKRRLSIERDGNFYGAMDGASKFVRGDAVAGFIITAVNIIGGIAIGVLQQNLSAMEAMKSYSLLTIGDGLVSQIPALIVSTAAGLLISKISSEGSANAAIFNEITKNSVALVIAAMMMIGLSLMPGIPKIPFIGVAAALMYAYSNASKARLRQNEEGYDIEGDTAKKNALTRDEEIIDMLQIDRVKIELGYNIVSTIRGIEEESSGETLVSKKIKQLRKMFLEDRGIIIPSVRIVDNISIGGNDYIIKINEIPTGNGSIKPDMVMVISNDDQPIKIQGEETIEPAFGVKAVWIPYTAIEEAREYGYVIAEPQSVVITHLSELINKNIKEIFIVTDFQELVEKSGEKITKIMSDITAVGKINIYTLHAIMCELLLEGLSIRDLAAILSYVGSGMLYYDSTDDITEFIRSNLQRQITNMVKDENGTVNVITISDDIEAQLLKIKSEGGVGKNESIGSSIIAELDRVLQKINNTIVPCIMTHYKIRKIVRQIVEQKFNFIQVISSRELLMQVQLNIVDTIS